MLTKIYSSGEKRGEKNATYTTKKKKKTQPNHKSKESSLSKRLYFSKYSHKT